MKKIENLKPILILSLFLLVGLYLRTLFILTIPTKQLYDFETYQQLAVNIATGQGYTLGGYPVAWQGMLYSTGLGVIYKLLGNTSEMIPKVINVLLSEMTIIFVYMIMKRIYNKPWAIWISVFLMTFMPHQIMYCNVIGTEIITAFFLSAAIYLSLLNIKMIYKFLGLGILCGFLALSKPFFLAYPVILAVSHYMMTHKWKQSLLYFASVYVVMMLVILPWSLRNLEKYDRWIPVSYNSGFNLYINNNAQNVHGGWMDYHDVKKPEALEQAIEAEVQSHGASVKTSPNLEVLLKPYAVDYIKAHPIEFLKLGVIRIHSTYFNGAWDLDAWTMNAISYDKLGEVLPRFADVDEYTYARFMNFFRAISDMILGVISGFGIVFVFMNVLRMFKALYNQKLNLASFVVIPAINLAFVSLVFFVYEGQPRYNFIVLFLLIMTFAIGFDAIRDKFLEVEGKPFKIEDR
ncbi:ArnT family glycosyltransferase [Fusibacter ferrireducens]|uniref:Glycosyltransferase RgtA/B/C/D-like domain-containing protein n=1 Tax=Fusibacter ferrireducens TaxID=2785058 RepID=A0ABR9ZVS8_9FIRM|nr:hypothetical protein [Fusibacter ferrireducens]MBF4694571.1 hypothetical protein [Fusibacter ferrireducens]